MCSRFLTACLSIVFAVLSAAAAPSVAAESVTGPGEPPANFVTEKRIDEATAGYEMRLAYPQIGVAAADAEMDEFALSLASDFRRTLRERAGGDPPYSAQLTYQVARNDEAVVSVLFAYTFYFGGAHPNSTRTAFNYLMPDEQSGLVLP